MGEEYLLLLFAIDHTKRCEERGERMEERMSAYEVQNAAIDTFKMLMDIKNAMPAGVENPVLEKEIKVATVKLETFGINLKGLK